MTVFVLPSGLREKLGSMNASDKGGLVRKVIEAQFCRGVDRDLITLEQKNDLISLLYDPNVQVCVRCLEEFSNEEFFSGTAYCRACLRLKTIEHSHTEKAKENSRERSRRYRKKHPDRISDQRVRYNEKYPEKVEARRLLSEAIRQGNLTPATKCERCGDEPDYTLTGHHTDYSLPLDVEWLCRVCHGLEGRTVDLEAEKAKVPIRALG